MSSIIFIDSSIEQSYLENLKDKLDKGKKEYLSEEYEDAILNGIEYNKGKEMYTNLESCYQDIINTFSWMKYRDRRYSYKKWGHINDYEKYLEHKKRGFRLIYYEKCYTMLDKVESISNVLFKHFKELTQLAYMIETVRDDHSTVSVLSDF